MLQHYGHLKKVQKYSLGSDALRFQHRFQQFQHFNQPSPIRFEEFETHTKRVVEMGGEIITYVKNWFSQIPQHCKSLLAHCPHATKEFKSRVRKLAKLSVMNGISLQAIFKNDNVEKPQPPAQSLTCVLVFKFEGASAVPYFPLVEQSATK